MVGLPRARAGHAVAALDLLASRPQYRAHLQPVWDALPAALRGSDTERTAEAVLLASAADLAAAVRARYRHIAYLEHGIGQTYGPLVPGYPGGRGRQHVGLFLSPNDHAAAADRRAYPAAQVVVVGDPALERVPHREPGPPAVAMSFHWECGIAPEARSALSYYRRALAEVGRAVPLLGHAHPKARAELERVWGRIGVEFVADWHEVCRRADLYVTDNSSTLFEFASTGRPVVVLNAPWYRRHVHHGLRFWEAATVGVQVDEPGQLVAAITAALVDPPEQQAARAAALALVYSAPAGAAERAGSALEQWLKEGG